MGVAVKISRKAFYMPGNYCSVTKFFCTLRHIVCQRVYVIYDAIIYSKRPLLRLRPVPSNNELSAVKAHCQPRRNVMEVACDVH